MTDTSEVLMEISGYLKDKSTNSIYYHLRMKKMKELFYRFVVYRCSLPVVGE